jgi:antitoxin component of RelBE/YafQ-DinJ toxin-antitoxin module
VLTARVEQNVAEWLKLCAKEYNLTTSEFINQLLTLSYRKNNK